MTILPILKYPDIRLKKMAEPVLEHEIPTLQEFIDNMFETMEDDDGAGLAATQVNVQKRIVTMDIDGHRMVLINPEITHREGSQEGYEACLSVPIICEKVKRAAKVSVQALDRHGKFMEFDAEERFAVCVQHEIDHLDGILFIDRLPSLKRKMVLKKFEKIKHERY